MLAIQYKRHLECQTQNSQFKLNLFSVSAQVDDRVQTVSNKTMVVIMVADRPTSDYRTAFTVGNNKHLKNCISSA